MCGGTPAFHVYPVSAVMIVSLVILNDGSMLSGLRHEDGWTCPTSGSASAAGLA